MKRVVVVICDGLRADMICPAWTPNLYRIKSASRFYENHQSVFPSTTRTTAASIATGCYPASHGLEGNCMAVDEGQGLIPLSVGPANFRDRLRRATGQTLRVPTVSERVAKIGSATIYSNVSPGAAYFHDPDGFGHVFHRSGSFGPGLRQIFGPKHLNVSHDQFGDNEMTLRFCDQVLIDEKPVYSVLWQCEPDHTQHGHPLGSPEHLTAITAADENTNKIVSVVDRQLSNGEKILLIIASDHGHETVSKTIPLSDLLINAGLKEGPHSTEIVLASNGFSANIYMSNKGREKFTEVINYLNSLEDIESVYWGHQLEKLGHRVDGPLVISVTTKNSQETNQFGVKGHSIAIEDPLHQDTTVGCGQHGGLGKNEQRPFLMIKGYGVEAGSKHLDETSAVDLAPTALKFLDVEFNGMDGRALPLVS